MKSFFRLVLLALVLLVVALISALTAMRLAIHGHEVAVPDLVGKSPAAARMIAEQSGLEINVERQYYSPTRAGRKDSLPTPAGRKSGAARLAGSCRRKPGSAARRDSQCDWARANASPISISAAADWTSARSHKCDYPTLPRARFWSQAPPPNASGISAPKISLLVAEPAQPQALLMPSFIGQPLGSATAALQDAGLQLGNCDACARRRQSSVGDITSCSIALHPPPASSSRKPLQREKRSTRGRRGEL